ncbi:CD1375 family protein [Faecalimonas sp. LCP19S3_D12]
MVKGKKKIEDVPAKIRDQVKELLVDLEVPELAEQKDRNGLFILQR